MTQELPQLAFLPVNSLLLHEQYDEQRILSLIHRIRASNVFRNPPIVYPLQDGRLRYMVLDGANRTMALHKMGYLHALVQIVQPNDSGLGLHNWNHVVWELNQKRFLTGLSSISGIELMPVKPTEFKRNHPGMCVTIHTTDSGVYRLCSHGEDLKTRVSHLNAIVESYRVRARIDRTKLNDMSPLIPIYPQLCGLVIFPKFTINDLLVLAADGYLLPTGITRFIISPRALHLNYPLGELASSESLDTKNEKLQRWLMDQIARKHVRYYAESTFLFNE